MVELHGLAARALPLIFGAIGALLVGHAVWSCIAGIKSRAWPFTLGSIMVDDLQRDTSGRPVTYRAEVGYRYRVEDKDYAANRVFFGDSASTNAYGPAARRVAKYPVGSSVRVFYDPARPSTAVLEPGINWQTWLELALGLIVVAIGVFGVLRVV